MKEVYNVQNQPSKLGVSALEISYSLNSFSLGIHRSKSKIQISAAITLYIQKSNTCFSCHAFTFWQIVTFRNSFLIEMRVSFRICFT